MRFKTALLPLTMPLVLAACFGSGGGGGGSNNGLTLDSTPTADFTSFSDITANSLVELSAARSVNYATGVLNGTVQQDGVMTTTGSSDLLILTGDADDPNDPNSPLDVDGTRLIVRVPGVDGKTLVRDFLDAPAFSVGGYSVLEITNDAQAVTDRLFFNTDEELDYMTFGLWEIGVGEASIDLGGTAWGASTPTEGPNSMPTGGLAGYTGVLIGHNVTAGTTVIYTAESFIGVDFTQNTVSLSSTNTRTLGGGITQAGLDIQPSSGTISGNGFVGNAIDLQANGTFEGSFGGSFFGPDAAEAGGWFEVRNTDQQVGAQDRYFGSFGGARGAIVPSP